MVDSGGPEQDPAAQQEPPGNHLNLVPDDPIPDLPAAPRPSASALGRLAGFIPRSIGNMRDLAMPQGDLPALHWWKGLPLASVLLDDLALTVVSFAGARLTVENVTAELRAIDQALDILDKAGLLAEPQAMHPEPPPLLQQDVRIVRRTRPGLAFEQLSFPSAYRPPVPLPRQEAWFANVANQTVHAYLLRHAGGPRPWVVALHPYGTGVPFDLLLLSSVTLHRQLGVNVIHPVTPRHGPRRGHGGAPFPGPDVITNLLGFSQAISDTRQLLTWVTGQGASSIGVHGVSLGGFLAALLAGLEPGLACAVVGVAPCDFNALQATFFRRYLGDHALAEHLMGAPAQQLSSIVSPLTYPPLVRREDRYIFGARGDRFAPPEDTVRLRRHWDGCKMIWLQHGHVRGSMSGQAKRFVADAFTASGVRQPPA